MEITKYKTKSFFNSVFGISALVAISSLVLGLICSFLKVPSKILFVIIFMTFMAAALIAVINGAFSFVIDWQIRKNNLASFQSAKTQLDKQWKEKNKQGRCGRCNNEFTDSNPDAGGGQCRNCWASWG